MGIQNSEREFTRAAIAIEELTTTVHDQLDEIEKRVNRPSFGDTSKAHDQYKAALSTLVRSGDDFGFRALSVGSDPDGGWSVIASFEAKIKEIARDISPLRNLASVVTISTSGLELLIDPSLAEAQWVGEIQQRGETTGPQLAKIYIPVNEIFAQPKCSQSLIDDLAVDVAAWITNSIGTSFAIREGAAFINGNSNLMPKGIMTYDKSSDDDFVRQWDSLQYVPSGSASAITGDAIVALSMKLRTPYRSNATFIMSRESARMVKTLKDGNGRYIWGDEGLNKGQPPMLCGFNVSLCEDMDAIGAGKFPIAFGDFRKGYTIVDRQGVRVVRDALTEKPYIKFYTTKRLGGGVVDFNAIKHLKIGTT